MEVRDRVLAAGHRHFEAVVERVVPDDQSAAPGRRPQLQVLEAAERQVDRKPARYREVSLERVALGPGVDVSADPSLLARAAEHVGVRRIEALDGRPFVSGREGRDQVV